MKILNLLACFILGFYPSCRGFFLDSIFRRTTTIKPFVYQPGVLDPAAAMFCPKHLDRTKSLMYNTYTRHCFTINIEKTANWYTAKSYCEGLGGYLARLRDFNDNMFVRFRVHGVLQYPHKHIWIGLSDTEKEGDYRWTNGDSLNYTNWAVGEPTRAPWQNCIAFNRDVDKWDDKECHLKYAWVCQFDHDAKPVTTSLLTTKPSTLAPTTSSSTHTTEPTTVKPTTILVPTTATPSTAKPSMATPSSTPASTTSSTTPKASTTHAPSSTPLPSPTSTSKHLPTTPKHLTVTHRFPGYEIIG